MTAQLDDALLQARAGVPWRTLIYTSHFASAWGERMWEFSAGILLLGLGGGRSLQLTATFAFALQLTQMLLGAKVGGLVDRGNPQTTPVAALAGQSFGIALAALSAASALHLAADGDVNVPFSAGLIIAFSCVAKLSSLASKISVENHWAVALAAGEAGPQVLTKLTSNMRAIDLSCKMMAPIVAGLIMSAFSPAIAGLAVALANALAWPVEVICLLSVYRDPWCRSQLEARYHKGDAQAPSKSNSAPTLEENAWKLYFSQRIWPSAFALSMLHLTVLSFGQLMTAYVLTLGVDVAIVSLYRSLGEVFGFAATQMKPWLDKHQGLSHAHVATIFIWFQLAMLVPSAVGASFWARHNLASITSSMLLVGGVGVSRFGLWGFDLSVSLMLQNEIQPPQASGRVIGVQRSLEATFGMLAGVAGIMLSDPSQFQYLAFGSWVSVCGAAVLHTFTAGCPGRG